jgi:hypothetical protein
VVHAIASIEFSYSALGVDVANVGGHTRRETDIVEAEFGDARVELQEEGQRLSNATCCTEDDDFGRLEDWGQYELVSDVATIPRFQSTAMLKW